MAAVFVPCVVGLSLLTLAVWLALTLSGAVPDHWYRDQPGSPGEECAVWDGAFFIGTYEVSCVCFNAT